MRDYLGLVAAGKLPKNHTILYQLQDIFNLLPNLNLQQFSKSFAIKFNDQLLVVYLASLIRAIVALHHLIQNKISNHEAEKQEGHKKEVTNMVPQHCVQKIYSFIQTPVTQICSQLNDKNVCSIRIDSRNSLM